MGTINATEARASLPELLDRVGDGEEITITRHGKPVAVLVRPEVLRRRRAAEIIEEADRLQHLMEEARAGRLPAGPGLTPERAEELVAYVRASRDSR
jgi:prevent-host-death family protein